MPLSIKDAAIAQRKKLQQTRREVRKQNQIAASSTLEDIKPFVKGEKLSQEEFYDKCSKLGLITTICHDDGVLSITAEIIDGDGEPVVEWIGDKINWVQD